MNTLPKIDADAIEALADNQAVLDALVYRVMDYNADLADRWPSQAAWDDLEETVRDTLRFLPRAIEDAERADDEQFCPKCLAGAESGEHFEKCGWEAKR